ncbi:MAG: hypothetical protein HY291_18255 [Planctomycetes bacterium]|nr:hypothetical protein [Planctomycetota bacterium]
MALPNDPKRRPGSVRRTVAALPAEPPPSRPSARTVAPAARPVQQAPVAPPPVQTASGGTGGTAVRRRPRPVRRNSDGGGIDVPPIFIRIGVVCVIAVIAAVFNVSTSHPSGDMAYWNAATDLDKRLERGQVKGTQEIRRQVNALPISGVSDPKLHEFHSLNLEILDLVDRSETDTTAQTKLLGKTVQLDKLIDELNLKYAGHK